VRQVAQIVKTETKIIDIVGSAAEHVRPVCPIGHQTACFDEFPDTMHRGQSRELARSLIRLIRQAAYPIDLETLTSSAEVLDMICQVAMKEWATAGCISGLVRAINDLLQPQAHLCSMGADQRLRGDEIVRLTKWAREQVKYN
jgi:hypothetical protein